jgi:hypothetical protein
MYEFVCCCVVEFTASLDLFFFGLFVLCCESCCVLRLCVCVCVCMSVCVCVLEYARVCMYTRVHGSHVYAQT